MRGATNIPDVYIRTDNVVNMNNFLANRNAASKRLNIWINNKSTIYKKFSSQTSVDNQFIGGVNVDWKSSGYWKYNGAYNLYLNTIYNG